MNYKRTVSDLDMCGPKGNNPYGFPFISECVKTVDFSGPCDDPEASSNPQTENPAMTPRGKLEPSNHTPWDDPRGQLYPSNRNPCDDPPRQARALKPKPLR
jgi:hypothetical protein